MSWILFLCRIVLVPSLANNDATSGECSTCGKVFSRRYHLLRHHLVHTREKPFKCAECDKSFSRADHCKNHVKTHNRGILIDVHCTDGWFSDSLVLSQLKTVQLWWIVSSHIATLNESCARSLLKPTFETVHNCIIVHYVHFCILYFWYHRK